VGEITRVKMVLIIAIILLTTVSIYSAYWILSKPALRIESSSMMHGPEPAAKIYDHDDYVAIEEVESREEITTYYEGKMEDYKVGGTFGDVIVYKKNGIGPDEAENMGLDSTYYAPVIHRALLWLEYNDENGKFNIPELNLYELDGHVTVDLSFPAYSQGEADGPLTLSLPSIIENMHDEPHSGFITKGDGNPIEQIDQYGISGPVKVEWIIGKTELIDNRTMTTVYYVFISVVLIDIVCAVVLLKKNLQKPKQNGHQPNSTKVRNTMPPKNYL
jgi:hypothetical protein